MKKNKLCKKENKFIKKQSENPFNSVYVSTK